MSLIRPGAPRFPPGTILGARYRVERLLAAGTKGMMLEATDLERGRPVAIKVLRPGRRGPQVTMGAPPPNPRLEERFAREARIAGRLSSAHLAAVCAFGHTDGGDPFLVTELLQGHDLAAELAERGPLPLAEAVDAVVEACAGVAEAHAAGLVHRDLKPSNLFVTRDRGAGPSVKVLDFGLTRAPQGEAQVDLTERASDFGTPQHLAPEQLRGTEHVDARADQHALGAVLYELITGKPPFQAPDVTRLAVAIAVDPPPRARAARPETPAALDAAIRRALGKLPGDRFPDLRAFAEAIAPFGGERSRAALQAVHTVGLPAPPRRSTPHPSLRNRDPAPITSDPGLPPARRSPVLTVVSAMALLAAFGAYQIATRPAPVRAAAASAPAPSASTTATLDAGSSPPPK